MSAGTVLFSSSRCPCSMKANTRVHRTRRTDPVTLPQPYKSSCEVTAYTPLTDTQETFTSNCKFLYTLALRGILFSVRNLYKKKDLRKCRGEFIVYWLLTTFIFGARNFHSRRICCENPAPVSGAYVMGIANSPFFLTNAKKLVGLQETCASTRV